MKKTLAVAILIVVAVALSVALAQEPGSCRICWRDGGYFDDNPWYCNEAEDFGYKNCAASAGGCANWKPLCERGNSCRYVLLLDRQRLGLLYTLKDNT